METFKKIPGLDKYEISKSGVVRNIKTNRIVWFNIRFTHNINAHACNKHTCYTICCNRTNMLQ